MILARTPLRVSTIVTKGLIVTTLGWVSLLAVGLALYLQWIAVGAVLTAALVVFTLFRPRFGLYLAIFLAVVFEPRWASPDPLTSVGWIIQVDVSSWSPVSFIKFSPLELLLLVVAFSVIARATFQRGGLRSLQTIWPLLCFLGLVSASIGFGLLAGGDFKVSLFEVRSLFVAGLIALLIPSLLPQPEHVHRLISLICWAVVLLSLQIIWRRLVILADVSYLDLEFAHETPVWMNVVLILFLARLIWSARRRERILATLLIPLILLAETLTQRRAGWLSLDVGLLFLSLFVFRLRRRFFFWLVLPLMVVYAGYVAVFWNASAQSSAAQPARAVRSLVAPDERDAASNLYRVVETANVRLNIRAHPLTGLGFGKEYIFYYPLPDLSSWPFWHYTPHNAVLGIWLKMGPIGFIAFLALSGVAIVRGVQLLKRIENGRSAPILAALVGGLLMVMVFSYVDLGLTFMRIGILWGVALGVIGTWGRAAARARHLGH